MMLTGQRKKVVKEVIRYYVETTGKDYEDFILEVQKPKTTLEHEMAYSEWLAIKSYELLKKYDITMQDCIENKDVIRAAIKEEESRMGGEFYTPEIWAADGREYLKNMLGDQWGKAYIWDASCGTGNLLKTIDYPQDKIFMSSLLAEDIEMVKSILPNVTAFQGDFVNGIDWDENNTHFSDKLPPRLVEVFKNNEPIVFYMNPPYKVMEATSSDVGAHMASQGMAKCALDIFHQFMYRMVMLKRFYNLTNVYMGIFGPVTMFHSKMIEPMYNEFKDEFKFVDGMCFSAGDFSNTSESVGWIVGYTAWRTKQEGEEDKSIVLAAKAVGDNDEIKVIGKRLITNVEENIHEWVIPQDIVRSTALPMVSTYKTFIGVMGKAPVDALGFMMSSNYVIRATRRACVTSLPNPDNTPVTQENFWKCVASFAARRCYASKTNPFNNSQYYSKPDMSVEGYNQWLVDALVIFLFDHSSQQTSYRGIEQDGQTWDVTNRLFPIDAEILKSVITDENLLADMEANQTDNKFILNILQEVQHQFSPEAMELYQHVLSGILYSLQEDVRAVKGYETWTGSWDAGLIQLRAVKGLLPDDFEDKYVYHLSKLKHKLYDGIYKYGFMMDTAFAVEEDIEDLDDEEEVELV